MMIPPEVVDRVKFALQSHERTAYLHGRKSRLEKALVYAKLPRIEDLQKRRCCANLVSYLDGADVVITKVPETLDSNLAQIKREVSVYDQRHWQINKALAEVNLQQLQPEERTVISRWIESTTDDTPAHLLARSLLVDRVRHQEFENRKRMLREIIMTLADEFSASVEAVYSTTRVECERFVTGAKAHTRESLTQTLQQLYRQQQLKLDQQNRRAAELSSAIRDGMDHKPTHLPSNLPFTRIMLTLYQYVVLQFEATSPMK